jgi:hypothetical protein
VPEDVEAGTLPSASGWAVTRIAALPATSSRGALRVAKASGTVAILQDGKGMRVQFDLTSKTFR